MFVFVDSLIWNKHNFPKLGNTFDDSVEGSVIVIETESNYVVNVPMDVSILTTDFKFIPVNRLLQNPTDYSVLFYRPIKSELIKTIFSNVTMFETFDNMLLLAFLYGRLNKLKESNLLKSADYRRYLSKLYDKKIPNLYTSYSNDKKILSKNIGIISQLLYLINNYIYIIGTKDDNDDARAMRILILLLLVTASFGAGNDIYRMITNNVEDEIISILRKEMLLAGIKTFYDPDEQVITIDLVDFKKTISLVTQFLFGTNRPKNRNVFFEKVTFTTEIDADVVKYNGDFADFMDLKGNDMLWIDGVIVKK